MSNQEMNVYLYDFAADGSCSADIFLPATGNMVRGIKVMELTPAFSLLSANPIFQSLLSIASSLASIPLGRTTRSPSKR